MLHSRDEPYKNTALSRLPVSRDDINTHHLVCYLVCQALLTVIFKRGLLIGHELLAVYMS